MHDSDRRFAALQRAPQFVEVDITSRCNQKCTYCAHFGSASETGEDLPKDEWLEFFDELGRAAVLSVSVGGGEPFVRSDILEILDGIARNRMRFDIGTNGTLITDEIARFLALTKRCNYVQVSIDGSRSEMHDVCRGKGSFERAMEGLDRLRKHGVPVAVRATINKHNVREIDETAKFFLEDLDLPSFTCCDVFRIGMGATSTETVGLDADDISYAMERLTWLNENKYVNRIFSPSHGPMGKASGWLSMETARKRANITPQASCLLSCSANFVGISVRADGVYNPCGQLSHIELGRINRDRLLDIWKDHPELNRLRVRGKIPLSKFEFCEGCEYVGYCPGGCPGIAYALTGRDEHPSPDSCLRLFLKNGGRLPQDVAVE